MSVALIVAAGSGERLGADRPEGVRRACRAADAPVERRRARGDPRDRSDRRRDAAGAISLGETDGVVLDSVRGGASRSESVRLALAEAGPGDPVLVHDAARPLLTSALAQAVLAALDADPGAGAAIAAAPVTDTIKRAGRDGGEVRETLDRGELWAVQTPQVFRRAALERALDVDAETLASATDDAWLIERAGGKVIVVPSTAENIKVTTPFDLRVAELLLGDRGSYGRTDPA